MSLKCTVRYVLLLLFCGTAKGTGYLDLILANMRDILQVKWHCLLLARHRYAVEENSLILYVWHTEGF